jgi:acetyl-CoA carboxylase biotin carboxyl carrier protein
MSITLDDIKIALAIIENGEGQEISLRSGDIELNIRRGPPGAAATFVPAAVAQPAAAAAVAAPAAQSVAQPAAPAGSSAPPSPTACPLHAPLTGVIYRAPAPDEPPFVEPGIAVGEESVVCIIDVMKVMNLIKAPAAGRIARIDVQDGHLVTKGDVVMWVEPA